MALRRAAHLDTMYQELPLPDRFQAARDDGFDAVELWSWEDRDLAAVRAAADRAGISICCCDGDGPVSLIDPDRREAYLGYLRRSLAAARLLGVPGVTIHSNGLGPDGGVLDPRDDLSHTVKLCALYDCLRASAALASFLYFYCNLIFETVALVSANTSSEIFESLLRVGPGDVVIGVSFPRYSSRTVQAMSFARDRGADTVAITDSEAAPLAPSCRHTLRARSAMASFVASLVAPRSLVNALLVAVSQRKNDELARTFQHLEDIWDEYGVYEKVQE